MSINKLFRNAFLILSLALASSALAQTTVTLQDGLNGYSGTTDNKIMWGSTADINFGADGYQTYTVETSNAGLVRFRIFAAEGGPVPNGATITSATLSLFKYWGPDGTFKASRLLKDWNELQSTWNVTGTGASWATPGALGASDVSATPDGQGSAPANNGCDTYSGPWPASCWLDINVTSGVQAFAAGTPNFGWRFGYVSGSDDFRTKEFYTRETAYAAGLVVLRPKLTITYTTAASSTVTLQDGLNGYSGTTDNKIMWGSTADINFGADGYQTYTVETSNAGLVRFRIFAAEGGPVPNGATITSATLSLFKYWGPDGTFKASRLLKDWNELQSTWNVTGTGASWATPGALGASDVSATPDGQGSAPANNGCDTYSGPWPASCWLDINVTSGVQAFAAGTPNFGWRFGYVSGSDDFRTKEFYTRETAYAAGLVVLRPKLTITYVGGGTTPPVPPTARLTATPTSGTGPLTVTFNASASTDGGSAITGLRLQFGDATADANWGDRNVTQSHQYASASSAYTATATLTVTNAVGTSAPVTVQITVNPAGGPIGPNAQLTVSQSSGTAPLSVSFSAAGSTQGTAVITGLRLVFDDGKPDATWTDKNQAQPHTYTAARATPYNATLTVTDANNLTSTKTVQVSVSDGGTDILPDQTQAAGDLGFTVPTFHSMSLYYNPAGVPANCTTSDNSGCQIWMRYRKATEPNTAWHTGHHLWFDPRTTDGNSPATNTLPFTASSPVTHQAMQYRARGSAVLLEPNTKYYFELGTGAQSNPTWLHFVTGTTWAPTFPTDPNVTTIPSQNGVYVIPATGGGNAGAYKVYDGWNGTSKNVVNRLGQNLTTDRHIDSAHGIVVKANFVIIRRVRVTGAALSGIYVAPDVHDVVIEDSEVDDWSWQPGQGLDDAGHSNPNSWGTWGTNEAGGIHLDSNNSRIVIQRNVIKAPHFGAFPWDTGVGCFHPSPVPDHPIGPNGISLETAGQQNVVRYNEITGDPANRNKWYMDGIGGGENFSPAGSPGADSDIYQNIVMHVFDDAIEAEGGGRNVRVWGNYVSEVKSAVATTTVHFGPTYIWRNVINHVRTCYDFVNDSSPGSDFPTNAFKMGGQHAGDHNPGQHWGFGIRYLYHNTVLQSPGAFGADTVIEQTGNGPESVAWTVAHNNILQSREDAPNGFGFSIMTGDSPTGSDFSANMCNGRVSTTVPDPVAPYKFTTSQLFYQSGEGAPSVPALGGGPGAGIGFYRLGTNSNGTRSAGIDVGQILPNFSDGFLGNGPDAGAHESGSPDPMKFGITAGQ